MRKLLALGMLLALTAAPMLAARPDNEKETDRLENSGVVMEEIMNIPDNIPQDLLDKAECVVVFPSVLKAAFIVGGSYGRGAMVCRSGEHFTGPWGAPSMAALEGGSVGFQLGGQATDFVLLIMNPRGAKAILSSKVKLGADMAAAAGPKGRDATAATDATLRAEIRRALERRIDELPTAFRTVFVMREVEDMTVDETAECLSIPAATVRTRLFRARALLREALARDMDMATVDVFGFAGERCAADFAEPLPARGGLLDQNEGRDGSHPHQVHNACCEGQDHQ